MLSADFWNRREQAKSGSQMKGGIAHQVNLRDLINGAYLVGVTSFTDIEDEEQGHLRIAFWYGFKGESLSFDD